MVTIDGVGRLSHPIQLCARRKALNSFKDDEREIINLTQDSKKLLKGSSDELEHVLILEDEATLGTQVEQWAVEYSSKFVHAAGPEFASTTAAVILGTAYVKKGLPEVSPLILHSNPSNLTCFTVSLSSSYAPRSLPSIRPPRRGEVHPCNKHIESLILPHNPSKHRHAPLRAPQARGAGSLPDAAAPRVPLRGVPEQRAGLPRCSRPLAITTHSVYRRQPSLEPGRAV